MFKEENLEVTNYRMKLYLKTYQRTGSKDNRS